MAFVLSSEVVLLSEVAPFLLLNPIQCVRNVYCSAIVRVERACGVRAGSQYDARPCVALRCVALRANAENAMGRVNATRRDA